jgi:DNA-binding response OmpR family regulator
MNDRPLVNHGEARIAVLDDDTLSLALTRAVLDKSGYEHVRLFEDPASLIDTCQTEHVDLVIIDMNMPGMTGLEVLRTLLDIRIERRPSTIVVTGSENTQERRVALELGASDYVRKPFEPHELAARVRNTIELRLLSNLLITRNDELLTEVVAREQKLDEAMTVLRTAEAELVKRAPPVDKAGAAAVSPELRERLLALQGYVGVMASQPFGALGDKRYGDYVERIGESLDQALRLIGIQPTPRSKPKAPRPLEDAAVP